ncbi:MAG: DNA-directed RNA polymerase subunit omega [Deltaproteobacteria bacterium]|jgi:DNA-directed RNA polymerase subunit omega|nr:DNA-directed RNA polymerase subunit omega [Deltaproteobacteria bacterium]MBK8693040.1 DNA-directed RNA polymerase subunit omega [Deltaproteobacteria bacterium]MBP6832906.1 DNA-directed RNA polymerase subunit omega [Deltaproteobacteria bacterium]TAK28486.1 MAG: DNA-directed RNA polymerase subunit omega [Myxococcaceae bacterium]
MARVTVEDCLDNEDNRFALVILASNRTRQIMKGAKVQLEAHKYKNKPAVLALREIAAGRVHYDRPSREAVDTYIEELKQRFG